MRSVSINLLRPCLVLLLLAPLLSLYGQPQVRFVDAQTLDLRHRLGKWKEAQASMEASGLSPTQRMFIMAGSDTRLWPPAITTQPASATTEPYLRNYVLFEVFRFQQDGRERVVALMPVLDNLHMPDDMRPLGDIHLVLFSDGVEAVASGLRPSPPIREPLWDTLPKVRVREPAGLFATYQLLQDHEARRVLAAAGMDDRAISLMGYRSHEKQWPTGMSSFDARYPRIGKLRKLRVAEVARWDDKVLLLAPAAHNRHLPKAMRPVFDLYLVYSASALGIRMTSKRPFPKYRSVHFGTAPSPSSTGSSYPPQRSSTPTQRPAGHPWLLSNGTTRSLSMQCRPTSSTLNV